jgi:5-methylcytosine-specific restriction endonuclease McrA
VAKPKIDKEVFEQALMSSGSWKEFVELLKGKYSWGKHRTLKRYAKYYGLDTSKLDNPLKFTSSKPKYTPEEIFKEDSHVPNTVAAKFYRRLYPAVNCAECGIGTVWNGKPLTLHIDHINGHGTDWRLENCRYLCPNCHYQTDTHGTKRGLAKRAGEIRATPAELSEAFEEYQSYKIVGMMFGLSDRTVKNMIRKYQRFCDGTP